MIVDSSGKASADGDASLSVSRFNLFSKLSSNDDSARKELPMESARPWWMDDPELKALSERALAELERGIDASDPARLDEPDPVVAEFYSGEAGRTLSAVRDELGAARARYKAAVLAARAAGLSWTEIARLLGVSRQRVHRQFRAHRAD